MSNGKPTNREAALTLIDRALAETGLPNPSMLVLQALLYEARKSVEVIAELVRPRKKAAKEPAP